MHGGVKLHCRGSVSINFSKDDKQCLITQSGDFSFRKVQIFQFSKYRFFHFAEVQTSRFVKYILSISFRRGCARLALSDLKIGIVLDIFILSGKTPDEKDRLIFDSSGSEIRSSVFLIIEIGIK